MSKSTRSSAAVLDEAAPAAAGPPAAIKVTISDPDGVVLGDRHIRQGATIYAPRGIALSWVAVGRARPVTLNRYYATTTTLFADRLFVRGEVGESEWVAPTKEGEPYHNILIPLAADQEPPSPLPADPFDERTWRLGPRVRCEVLRRARLAPGHGISEVGATIELRESVAIFNFHHGKVEILDSLSPAGRDVLAIYRRGPFAPDYAKVAERHRKQLAKVATEPTVKVRLLVSGNYLDEYRAKGTEMEVSPENAVVARLDGRAKIIGEVIPRMERFAENVLAHRRSPRTVAWPQY